MFLDAGNYRKDNLKSLMSKSMSLDSERYQKYNIFTENIMRYAL